jgi:hypothetical protein
MTRGLTLLVGAEAVAAGATDVLEAVATVQAPAVVVAMAILVELDAAWMPQ